MRALTRKVLLHADVELKFYAQQTEGFTGADLQAFIYNAQLESVHDIINQKIELSDTHAVTTLNDEQNAEFIFLDNESKNVQSLSIDEKNKISEKVSYSLKFQIIVSF